jgi:tetratricopeptide (TPR) repeat protein
VAQVLTVPAAWRDHLDSDPEAARLLAALAHLAPEPVPLDILPIDPDRLCGPGLAEPHGGGLRLPAEHASAIRAELSAQRREVAQEQAATLVAAACPASPDTPASWPRWAVMRPHLLALDLATTDDGALRAGAVNLTWYLRCRGDAEAALRLASRLHLAWSARLGEDHFDVLRAAHNMAQVLRDMGQYAQARQLAEDSLARQRRMLGEDHRLTLATANNLVLDLHALGEHGKALELATDTLARCRRVLGEDDPDTLTCALNHALELQTTGEVARARELDEDTRARYRRVLGEDHPLTLLCANNLGADLSILGQYEAARRVLVDTLARYRRVLDEGHPDLLRCAANLADTLRHLGRTAEAGILDVEVRRGQAALDARRET